MAAVAFVGEVFNNTRDRHYAMLWLVGSAGPYLGLGLGIGLAVLVWVLSVTWPPPRSIPDGISFVGGVNINGRGVTWPFAQITLTADTIEVSPRRVNFFHDVCIHREPAVILRRRTVLLLRGIVLRGTGRLFFVSGGESIVVFPVRYHRFADELKKLGWAVADE